MKLLLLSSLILTGMLIGCQTSQKSTTNQVSLLSDAETLLKQVYAAHGGDRYVYAHYQFTFRGSQFRFNYGPSGSVYEKTKVSDESTTVDKMVNGAFFRNINNKEIALTEKEINVYGESLNSVIYFATLPHKLLDPAVNLKIVGETTIQEKAYDILMVTFDQEGGGKDHDDQFHYWINQSDHTIDFLAYNYKTNNGGVRFRSAYNRRVVDGVIFQDYINYKAEVGTPLRQLPALFEKGALKELSRIETEDIKSLK